MSIREQLPPITDFPLTAADRARFACQPDIVKLFDAQEPPPKPKEKSSGKGQWTADEDKQLLDAMASFQGHICWEELSKRIPGRTAKQCRERWQFRLHPDVSKAPFQPWEDEFIIFERQNKGNHWTEIASKLPGRTSCAVKNRWYTVLRNRKGGVGIRKTKNTVQPASQFRNETLMLRDRLELWKN